jgi:hypothetical protein
MEVLWAKTQSTPAKTIRKWLKKHLNGCCPESANGRTNAAFWPAF